MEPLFLFDAASDRDCLEDVRAFELCAVGRASPAQPARRRDRGRESCHYRNLEMRLGIL
jgi:hypothetical protein